MSRRGWFLTGFFVVAAPLIFAGPAGAAKPSPQSLGPNVLVFDPSMPTSQIQAAVDAVAAQQVPNQFGPQRYALLFKPGTYGSAAQPLNFQVGYYTAVAGLGASPGDVVINGSVYVRNQCVNGSCTALNNFWRSLSNLTINVNNPTFGCYFGEFWAVSQAAPMRRVHVNGQTTLMDYCTGPSFASGGFIADSAFDGTVINGSQQQWLTRNSRLTAWTNGVWNQVFSGTQGAPAQCFPAAASCGGPVHDGRDEPGHARGAVPVRERGRRLQRLRPGRAPQHERYVVVERSDTGDVDPARPVLRRKADGRRAGDQQRAREGAEPALHPGRLRRRQDDQGEARRHRRARARVRDARAAERRRPDDGRRRPGRRHLRADLRRRPRELARAAPGRDSSTPTRAIPNDPTALQDVFFRIGGAAVGKATVSLEVNSDNVILDDIWAWRADHGNGVGWTVNTADTGVVVNGDDVTAYGLFVEHYQKYEVIWNGNRGTVVFFQNEMPYDPPSQAAWMEAPGVDGWAAFKIADSVTSFSGYGMGSYSFFNQGIDIFAAHAFEVPDTLPPASLHDLLTIFLDPSVGKGGILNVVNDTGGSSTAANPDIPVTVVSYP